MSQLRRQSTPPVWTGTGVNLTEQNVELVRNAYQLQYVMTSISGTLNGLRSAIRGQ